MKYIRNFFLFLFCILLSLYCILQIPTVKRFTIEKSIEFINTNADFNISYENFLYKDLKDISFSNILIKEKKNNQELLKVQKLQVGLNIFNLFFKRELNLKTLDFVDLVIYIDKNQNIFLNSESEKKSFSYFNSFSVNIENINFINCSIFFDNDDIAKNTKAFFDQSHFNISKINSHLENVTCSKKGIAGCIKNLSGASGKILLKNLSCEAQCYDKINLKNISIDSNLGNLSGNFGISNLQNFDYILDLKNLTLCSDKIPFLGQLESAISLECFAKGNLNDSVIQKFRLYYDQNSASLSGNINFNKFVYDLKNISGNFNLQSLGRIIPAKFIKMIPCQSGSFEGALKGEAQKGNFIFNLHSKIGDASANLDFDNIFSRDIKVEGDISLQNVDIKNFNITNINSKHKVSFSSTEKKIDNKIAKLNYNGVEVSDIEFNLQGNDKNYSGVCKIDDKGFKTNLTFKTYDGNIICSGICDLQRLNKFYGGDKRIDVKNDVNVKIKKDKILVELNNNFLKIGDVDLNLKLLKTTFCKEGKLSQFNLFSDVLDFKIYDIPEHGKDLKNIFLQFCENLYNWTENKPIKISEDPNFKIPFYINLKNSDIFHLCSQNLTFNSTNVYGDFIHTNGKKFLNLNVDKIENVQDNDKSLKNIDLSITIGFNEKRKLPIINIDCEIDKANFKDFYVNNILFKIHSRGENIKTNLSLQNEIFKFDWDVKSVFDNGKIIFDLQNEDSQCTLNNWEIEKGCIKWASKNISIENLTLGKNEMFFIFDYDLNYKDNEWENKFLFRVKNINIENWNEDTQYDIKGILNGEIKKNYSTFLEVNFDLDNLLINKNDFGSLKLTTKYNTKDKVYNYTLLAKTEDKVNLDVNGLFYKTNQKVSAQCFFNDFNLKILESFCDPVCSKLEGILTGHMNISGNIAQPRFWGDVDMKRGSVLFIPLNVEFKTNGHFKGDIDGLNITNFVLQDNDGGRADFVGKMKINFQDIPELYLNGHADKIQILHTTEKDNATFYGQLFCSGEIQFSGPVNLLTISGNATNAKKSKIFLNFRGDDDSDYGFIHFKNKNEKIVNKDAQNINQTINGIRLDINTILDENLITSVKIPFSEITIQGNGNLHVLTTFNDYFNIKGKFNVEEGNYLLSFQNLITKKFTIEKGGVFNFLGDINLTTLDIVATKDVILNDANENLVILKIITSGLIKDPEIKYDIDLTKSKNINSDIKSKIAINADMRNYYFLNLLLLGNFESNPANIRSDIFNSFSKTMQRSDEKSKFWINLDTDRFFSKKSFKVDLGFAYDKFEISKEISSNKKDFKDLILDDIEMQYAINEDLKLYTNIRKNKVKFGLKQFK